MSPNQECAAAQTGQNILFRVGQNHIYIRCIYGTFGMEITQYTIRSITGYIYGSGKP